MPFFLRASICFCTADSSRREGFRSAVAGQEEREEQPGGGLRHPRPQPGTTRERVQTGAENFV